MGYVPVPGPLRASCRRHGGSLDGPTLRKTNRLPRRPRGGPMRGGAYGRETTRHDWRRPLLLGECAFFRGAPLRSKASSSLDIARLFVVFSSTNLFFQTASHYDLAEASDRLLNRLAVPNNHLYHGRSFVHGSNGVRTKTPGMDSMRPNVPDGIPPRRSGRTKIRTSDLVVISDAL